MSNHHRKRMIQSVCTQANRTYRLWCARNPDFEKHGRVHIMAHSLGSALCTDILSQQPTIQPLLSEIPPEEVKKMKELFLFDTSSLFMLGSPVGVFMHLNQAQLIARKGRERTMHSPSDEALDRAGVFGCLAVDNLYNIFNPADPIAYLLNPCVDAKRAKDLPPTVIPNMNASMFNSLSTRVTRMFDGIPLPFASRVTTPVDGVKVNQAKSSDGEDEDMGMELRVEEEQLQGTLAERRFAALNPHGTVDFALPSEGNISEYVDMITAHGDYWQDQNVAAFVLSQICARKEDSMRTGLTVV